MIAPVPCQCRQVSPARWHHLFLSMLPTIKRHVEYAFQHLRGDNLDDAVTEVVANSLVAFVRLVELGKTDLAFPEVLARYGVDQARSGLKQLGVSPCGYGPVTGQGGSESGSVVAPNEVIEAELA